MPGMPKDVYPESGFRLPLPKREDMDEYGKSIYDKVVGPNNSTISSLRGNYGIALYDPKICDLEKKPGPVFAARIALEWGDQELAILITAREMNSQNEWTIHEPDALKEGLPQAVIDVVKYRKPVTGLPEKEATIIQFGRELYRSDKVSPETYAKALKLFGAQDLVRIVAVMSTYASQALRFRAFDLQLEPGEKPLLPLT